MGHVSKTPAGNFRANWRNLAGKQESKTFATEREANAYLAEMEVAKTRGTYVSPRAGKTKLVEYARRWLDGRNDEKTTVARDRSIIRTHILPTWGNVPLGKIDHSSIQQWVSKLGQDLSPATVRECGRLLAGILTLATKDRVIAINPAEGIRLPKRRQTDDHGQTITRVELTNSLLPEIPPRYRALVALAAGCGLRWGECIGLSWNAIDLDGGMVKVGRVAVEVGGNVTMKAYPKSKAGRRSVPMPPFVVELLKQHRVLVTPRPDGSIFANEAGGPMRRTTFRASIWRPALTRAGLLGKVVQLDKRLWQATWPTEDGNEVSQRLPNRRAARAAVTRNAHGGLRFHDLRHSYATWLVSDGVPLNHVARVMGHEHISTTLDRYTHATRDGEDRVRRTFADFQLTETDKPDTEATGD